MEDLSHLSRLKQQEEGILKTNEEECTKKSNLLKEYKQLKEKLQTLTNTTRQKVMVPQGKVAYFSGELIHTNEIVVLLGDNWFVERSAKQAAAIVDRRVKVINDQLESLHKEQSNLKSYLHFSESFNQKDADVKEIKEELPEDHGDDTKTSLRTAHKSSHSKVPRSVVFDEHSNGNIEPTRSNDLDPARLSFSHAELFDRLNELEAEELEDERRDNERTIRGIENGEYRQQLLDSDDDDDEEDSKRTSNIQFQHTSSRAGNTGEDNTVGESSYFPISSPADIYHQFMKHNPSKERIEPTETGVRSPPSTEVYQKGSLKSEKPLKSILKSCSRSNSNENLHPRRILKHSPEHQRSPAEFANETNLPFSRERGLSGSGELTTTNIDEDRNIFTGVDTTGGGDRFSEEHKKPILKVDSTDAFDEDPSLNSRSILKSGIPSASPDILRTILKSPENPAEPPNRSSERSVSFVETEDVRIIEPEKTHVRQLVNDQAFSAVVVERDLTCLPDFQAAPLASSIKPISKFKSARLKR